MIVIEEDNKINLSSVFNYCVCVIVNRVQNGGAEEWWRPLGSIPERCCSDGV